MRHVSLIVASPLFILSGSEKFEAQHNSTSTMSERIALRKRKREEETQKYINCDFILGSVAEIERL